MPTMIPLFAAEPAGPVGSSPSHGSGRPTAREVVADLALRLAQLDWPVAVEIEQDEEGREVVAVRRLGVDGSVPVQGSSTLSVGAASLGRRRLVEAILDELRARGWERAPTRGIPRDDVLWCAPA